MVPDKRLGAPCVRSEEAVMFSLFVVACVGFKTCEYITLTLDVRTQTACAYQAAIIAGMVRGRYGGPERELTYEFDCKPLSAGVSLPAGASADLSLSFPSR